MYATRSLARACHLGQRQISLRHGLRTKLPPCEDLSVPFITRSAAFFSTSAPRPAKTKTKVRVLPGRDIFAKVRFMEDDVPPLSFWAARACSPLVDDLTPEECLYAARKYAALAIRGPPNWRQSLLQPQQNSDAAAAPPSLYTLHNVSSMIMTGPQSPAWHLATHILHTGVQLGYAPSILTSVRFALHAGKLEEPMFELAREAFARLLAAPNPDPNACTLQGLILATRNTRAADDKALAWFARAMFSDNSHSGGDGDKSQQKIIKKSAEKTDKVVLSWDWQARCLVGQGKIHLKQGRTAQAQEILRDAALRLDNAEACWLYASTLQGDASADRLWFLRKAAASGIKEAARELAHIEKRALEDPDSRLGDVEKAEKQILADEWLGVAGDKAVY